MGLDSVELVLATEEHFRVEIPDGIAEKLTTVGALHGFLVTQIERRTQAQADSNRIFEELRELVSEQLGIPPERVTLDARFVEDLHVDE